MACKIANGAGFLGDNLDAPRRLVEAAEVDYLTLEYLAELTMSILARLREKNPSAGYAADFLTVLGDLCPTLSRQNQLKIVTNAGGVNPQACARAAAAILCEAHLGATPIGVVCGDDLLDRLEALQAAGCSLENMETGQPLSELKRDVTNANAYLGAAPIVEALVQGARFVITGRVADASLAVGPAVKEFGWSWDDYPRLAGASVAGHLIECGAQVTGGFYTHWPEVDLATIGYPVAEIAEDGSCVITKPHGSGGVVNRLTVCEQLVYEIGDPSHYLTPDVDVDFSAVEVEPLETDRVAVRGARGASPPDTLKVSLSYRDGYTASGQLLVYGRDCLAKAKVCGETMLKRLAQHEFDRVNVEYLGAGDGVPGNSSPPKDLREVLLRITVQASVRETVERFSREIAPLATSGPAGLAGYASARGAVRPVFAYWPTLIPRDLVEPSVEVRAAKDWIQRLDPS